MFGCRSAADARPSDMNRSRERGSSPVSGRMNLTRHVAEPDALRAKDLTHATATDPVGDPIAAVENVVGLCHLSAAV